MFYLSVIRALMRSFYSIEEKSKYITVPLQIIVFSVMGALELLFVDWWYMPISLSRDAKKLTSRQLVSRYNRLLVKRGVEKQEDMDRRYAKLVTKIKKRILRGKYKIVVRNYNSITELGLAGNTLTSKLDETIKGFSFTCVNSWSSDLEIRWTVCDKKK